ncbi:amidase [Methylosinus sp. Ce-a6]|uniref:amidase n=1 Tax=Methylosinus sp. Ce-a6 TaxID=2172005 RepID=UPI001359F638|nr:amidase [Methylosinus sp. Ce-a6]
MTDSFAATTVSLDIAHEAGADAPLAGASFVVKENIDVEGCVSTNGQPTWAASHAPAAMHAPVVDRLLAAGARLVGKAHMDEMAYSLLGANAHYGTPINPAAPDRHPGGSSSGSAVAVAAGLADFALGTDTAGSCRAPAAFCGIFGFRSSHGAISANGVVPLAESLDVVGWFARDLDLFARVGDALLPRDLCGDALEEAAILEESFAQCDEETRAAMEPALAVVAQNFSCREVSLGEAFWTDALRHFRNLQAYEAWRAHGAWIAAAEPKFGPGVAGRFDYAATVTKAAKAEADAFRSAARARVDAMFGPKTLLVVPTTPFAAPRLDEGEEELDRKRYSMFRTFLFASFFGLPQISLPLSQPAGAPPLGISLIGPRWSDRRLIAAARGLVERL